MNLLGELNIISPTETIIVFSSSRKALDFYLLEANLVFAGFVDYDSFRVKKGRRILYCFCSSYLSESYINQAFGTIKSEDKALPISYRILITKEPKTFFSLPSLNSLQEKVQPNRIEYLLWIDKRKFESVTEKEIIEKIQKKKKA